MFLISLKVWSKNFYNDLTNNFLGVLQVIKKLLVDTRKYYDRVREILYLNELDMQGRSFHSRELVS